MVAKIPAMEKGRIEEFPTGGRPLFVLIGAKVGSGVGVGVTVGKIVGTTIGTNIAIVGGMGVGVGVGVGEGIGVAFSAAKTVNDCIIVINIPDESLVLIVIVCSPLERVLGGRYVQFPLLSAVTRVCMFSSE